MFTALRYFHETARAGSIRRAADALHVSPSAVSRQIMSLEREFDVPLFERSVQGVRLTPAGELLARHTNRTFRDLGRVRGWIDDLKGLRRGHVIAHAVEGTVTEFLPAVLAEFRTRYPEITFTIVTGATDLMLAALVRDEADFVIGFNAPDRADIVTVFGYSEPVQCLVPWGHPLAGKADLTIADLIDVPLALPDPSFGLRRAVNSAFARHSARPHVAIDTNSLELTKQAALSGIAIAFLPAVTTLGPGDTDRIRIIPMRSAEVSAANTTVCVHRDRELPFATTEFLRVVGARFAALAEAGRGVLTCADVAFSATKRR